MTNFASYGTTSRLSNSQCHDWTIMVLVRGGLANSKLAGAEAHRVCERGEGGSRQINAIGKSKHVNRVSEQAAG